MCQCSAEHSTRNFAGSRHSSELVASPAARQRLVDSSLCNGVLTIPPMACRLSAWLGCDVTPPAPCPPLPYILLQVRPCSRALGAVCLLDPPQASSVTTWLVAWGPWQGCSSCEYHPGRRQLVTSTRVVAPTSPLAAPAALSAASTCKVQVSTMTTYIKHCISYCCAWGQSQVQSCAVGWLLLFYIMAASAGSPDASVICALVSWPLHIV